MDDIILNSKKEKHMDDFMDLFKVLGKYSLKIHPINAILQEENSIFGIRIPG